MTYYRTNILSKFNLVQNSNFRSDLLNVRIKESVVLDVYVWAARWHLEIASWNTKETYCFSPYMKRSLSMSEIAYSSDFILVCPSPSRKYVMLAHVCISKWRKNSV